ncbi:DNA primase large subunit PriL [Candidatus Bathyarchaeota archaeon]|nr:DNA primase large subunit PriL [Candidatus Bathyarchaeota archaeon]
MPMAGSRFTKNDLAKYPFLKETTDYVKKLDLRIDDLLDPSFANIIERAQERVEDSILYALVSRTQQNDEVEILSFPIAVILAIATKSSFIKKRYALAEAKQVYEDLKLESEERLKTIAQTFDWKLVTNDSSQGPQRFSLGFIDYVRNTTHLRDKRWKLVNRLLANGNVSLNKGEIARLLSEEVRKYIEKRLEAGDLPTFPAKIAEIAEKLKSLSVEKIGEIDAEEFHGAVKQEVFPPCIQTLFQSFSSGHHLSHIGRFTLTSFLVGIGMPSETVVELFKSFSDYSERMTRYQVEHIAGERGSRTRYIPPKCDTLKTHGVCLNPDRTCQRIRHPLAYYRSLYKA